MLFDRFYTCYRDAIFNPFCVEAASYWTSSIRHSHGIRFFHSHGPKCYNDSYEMRSKFLCDSVLLQLYYKFLCTDMTRLPKVASRGLSYDGSGTNEVTMTAMDNIDRSDHFEYGLIEMTLLCNVVFNWLSPYIIIPGPVGNKIPCPRW